jgi:hypothetical protein
MTKPSKPVSSADGEHIFPASLLTPLAIQWKHLSAAGRHKEAMLVLEQIIEGSTAMFERLAQFEDFHYTVDLPILVSAAQDKVIKWLLKWNPKKGRLFSWFSCHADTLIMLEDGSARSICELVGERYNGKVMCWDSGRGVFEAKQVIDWSEEPCRRKDWRKLVVKRASGYSSPVYMTHEHRVWTHAGWKQVEQLRPSDVLYVDKPVLTEDGVSVLIGLYLGDGSVLRNDFRVGHGKDQRFYNEWLRKKFRGHLYDCDNVGFNTFTETVMDHTGETTMYFHAADMWPGFHALAHPKKITPEVLNKLTPLALAIWYMDDGNYFSVNGATTLATMGFIDSERDALQQTLESKFGVKVTRHKNKSLYVHAGCRARFFDLIAPYVLREFDYKLDAAHRAVSKRDVDLVVDRIEHIKHTSCAAAENSSWEVQRRFKAQRTGSGAKRYGPTPESFGFKYDLTVADNHNFFAGKCKLLVSNSKCAKNSFRSELVKVNQYRKRYYATSDSLEKFYGAEDHEVDKHDMADEVQGKLAELTCRWGEPQQIGAIRYLTACIIDEEHEKQAAIRSAAYAYGISFELAKFFHNWAIVNLRHAFYEKAYVPFTEHDLAMAGESYTFWPELVNIVGIERSRELSAKLGGLRVKIPSLQYLAKLRDSYRLARDVQKSDQDPEAVAEVARRHKKTPRTAQEIFNEMVELVDPKRYGEYNIYGETEDDG